MADALPTCLLNGTLVATSEARISPLDRGFLFGDGVYEVIPCYEGHLFRLEAHLERLQNGLAALGMGNPHSWDHWTELLHGLVAANGGGDLGVYLEISRGAGAGRDFLPEPGIKPTVFGFCWRLTPAPASSLKHGLTAATLEDIRWQRCDVKSVALLGAVMLRMEAERRGANEAILIRDGRLAEGSSSAVFLVKNGQAATPPASHERLPSITRIVVGDALAALNIPLAEREIRTEELYDADEIWVASALREALPITRLDGRSVGRGVPGPVWRRVYDEFQAFKVRESR